MYSLKVILANQERLEGRLKIKLVRHPLGTVDAWVDHLNNLLDAETGKPKRALKVEELDFIKNERLLGMIDFLYFAERYGHFIHDGAVGGGLGRFVAWGSQIVLLDCISKLQETQTEAFGRGEPVDGLLLAVHKSRQLGFTMLVRLLHMHRLVMWEHTRAVAASVDDDKILELYERDKTIYNNLPWWLKPSIGLEEKAQHITFDKLGSNLIYQTLVQKSGLGQGRQFDIGHITEAASDPYNGRGLQHDYFPTIPQSPLALHVLETTPQGRDNWWRFFVEDVRKGGTRWTFVYVPWYAEPKKYRRQPPEGWEPSEVTIQHIKVVHDTSPEFLGKTVWLSRQSAYWWETTRAEYQRKDALALFLTNYSATPEESFQHTSASVFNSELIEHYRNQTVKGETYEIVSQGAVA